MGFGGKEWLECVGRGRTCAGKSLLWAYYKVFSTQNTVVTYGEANNA